jgi:hypothetical protein
VFTAYKARRKGYDFTAHRDGDGLAKVFNLGEKVWKEAA